MTVILLLCTVLHILHSENSHFCCTFCCVKSAPIHMQEMKQKYEIRRSRFHTYHPTKFRSFLVLFAVLKVQNLTRKRVVGFYRADYVRLQKTQVPTSALCRQLFLRVFLLHFSDSKMCHVLKSLCFLRAIRGNKNKIFTFTYLPRAH
jgi:hypothetical protein